MSTSPPAVEQHPEAEPLRIAVVDDEALARAMVVEYLAALPAVLVVAECANGFEAVKVVADHKPDLLLLDVQMPKLDGFEVLELVGRDVAVIFITAYDEYALKAFDVHAIDYLLKPFSLERLRQAIDRARAKLRLGPQVAGRIAEMARPDRVPAARVLVRDGARVHVLSAAKIAYAQAQDDYVCYSYEGKNYLKEQTLGDVESTLDPARFVRIHRSYLLNLDFLVRVDADARENRIAVLTDGRTLPVSRAGYARLSELL